jgi:hypothetical protein
MLGKGRIFIHFESRFHSENDLKFGRVTEYDFWFGVAAVADLWPTQLVLLSSTLHVSKWQARNLL